jgi:very-short-patch-repair endonuclease
VLSFRQLTWHYRSRDERLIAFSNAHIYDRTLVTFPGADPGQVLSYVPAPWQPDADINSPAPEVDTVVDLVLEHARERPDESLGVITMGIRHRDRIEARLRDRLRQDPELAAELSGFFDESLEERFFVKNLERVQGDERNAIILSIGYGKNARGDMVYRFGPLLSEGGKRRLNVAVTRAKNRITLVSSFSSRDMDPDRSAAEGVQLLRQYLQYAETGGANLGDQVLDKPALNPFEVDVRDTLARHGLKLTPQYGTSGYWIDFAVQHPAQPGRFVLAIECDGATYHSSQSARDRDRLRQEQLERQGWRFHRIWSTGSRSTTSPVRMSTRTVPYTWPLASAKSSIPRTSGAAVTSGSGAAATRRSTVAGCTAMPSVPASRAAARPASSSPNPASMAVSGTLRVPAAEPAHPQGDQHRPAARRAVSHRARIPAVDPRRFQSAPRAARRARPARRGDHHRASRVFHPVHASPDRCGNSTASRACPCSETSQTRAAELAGLAGSMAD